jgi:phytoene dehydrogenase-like protein
MGCESGGPMERFLGRLGLQHDVAFNFMNPDGYDIVTTPQSRFAIPSGSEAFRDRLRANFPHAADKIDRYFDRSNKIWQEGHSYEKVLNWKDIALAPWRYPAVLRHMRLTVKDVLDQLDMPPEVRVILAGQAGNLSAGPSEASFLMHCGMQESYARSAAYPKKGMRDLINRIAAVIERAPGCKIIKSCAVKHIEAQGGEIAAVVTDTGRMTAGFFVSNLDPKMTCAMTTGVKHLDYSYSDAVVSLYLGFKDTDLRQHGFGRHNFWFHAHHDIDREFHDLLKRQKYDEPWIFLSTPSLLADPGVLCDAKSSSLVLLSFVSYARMQELEAQGGTAYDDAMLTIENSFWKHLERHFLPNARRLATVKHFETTKHVAKRLAPPNNNVYGARLTPANYNMRRVTPKSPWKNLRFANATAFFPGVMPIIVGSMQLVDELVGARTDETATEHSSFKAG